MKWHIQHSFCDFHIPPQAKKKLTRNYVFSVFVTIEVYYISSKFSLQ